MALDIVIMAAGKGTRMNSSRPKVLHTLAGRPLLAHVLQTAATLGGDRIIVITGHGADEVEAANRAPGVQFVRQMPQLGTGRAVYTGMMAAPTGALKRWLGQLSNDNAQGEYYLTDVVAMAVADGVPVVATRAAHETEVLGVNSSAQLADLERRCQRMRADTLM